MVSAYIISISNWMGSASINQILLLEQKNIYLWVLGILAFILLALAIFAPKAFKGRISRTAAAITAFLAGILRKKDDTPDNDDVTNDENLYKAIEAAGYSYDPKQDIFYSNLDAWQRNMGYCRLYDEAAAPMGMIIDCEPIYFDYDGKKWMIEFWKGQYDLTTGCEMGVYTAEGHDLNIPGVFNGTFYKCAGDEDLLHMEYYLMKNGEKLFRREDKHWWLTGFKLGEYSEPSELTMYLSVIFKNEEMRDAFVEGLKDAGYLEHEIIISGNKVGLKFDKVHTPQPITRIEETDRIIQRKNQILCQQYEEITGAYHTFPEKVRAIQEQSSDLYRLILNMGRPKLLFESFDKIKDFLDE
jgi:hypothetical protein